jgi:hypothetical protein
MFSSVIGSIGSWERAINPSSDRPSTGISDHKPRYAHCPTACSLAPAFGDRVISSDEFIHIRQADAPRAQRPVRTSVWRRRKHLQRKLLFNRQARDRH